MFRRSAREQLPTQWVGEAGVWPGGTEEAVRMQSGVTEACARGDGGKGSTEVAFRGGE